MSKLKDVFSHMPYKKGDVGLEFECEANVPLPDVETGTWSTHEDHSLRGEYSNEYVTKNPIEYDKVINAIKYITKKVDGIATPNSTTTSWHVHFNALNCTPTQMVTNTLLYWLLEPIIIEQCGKHRRSNPFCVQLYNSKNAIKVYNDSFFNLLISKKPSDCLFQLQMEQQMRYGAQNLASLPKFGSVEYRAMEGTLDSDRVIKWVHTLKAIWSNDFKDPDEMMDYYYDKGITQLATHVLGEHCPLLFNDHLAMVESNAMLIASILNEVPYTWEHIERTIEQNLVRKPPPPIKSVPFKFDERLLQWIVIDDVAQAQPAQMWHLNNMDQWEGRING